MTILQDSGNDGAMDSCQLTIDAMINLAQYLKSHDDRKSNQPRITDLIDLINTKPLFQTMKENIGNLFLQASPENELKDLELSKIEKMILMLKNNETNRIVFITNRTLTKNEMNLLSDAFVGNTSCQALVLNGVTKF